MRGLRAKCVGTRRDLRHSTSRFNTVAKHFNRLFTYHVPTSRLLKDSPPHPRTSLSRSLFPRTSLLFTVFHCRCSVLLLTLHLPPAPLRRYPHTHVTCVQGDPQGRPQDLPYRPVTISPSSTSTPPPHAPHPAETTVVH